jgi:hypothetical protein
LKGKSLEIEKKPYFKPGKNIAIKIPSHEFDKTVDFYQNILGFEEINKDGTSVCFEFEGKQLWIDKVSTISQAEIWLEIQCADVEEAKKYFKQKGITRYDEIEKLPDGFEGFWISSPSNIVHLVCK